MNYKKKPKKYDKKAINAEKKSITNDEGSF